MKAMFIRHNMSSTKKILEELRSKRLIAIHFENQASVNPEDYNSAGEKALKKLWEYCESGAIVGADFRSLYPTLMLVGRIESGSKVEAKKFGDYIYKTVQLKNVQEISYKDYPLLSAIQPRGTIKGWPSAQKYLEAILEKREVPWEVNSLHPSQLEIICYEYLIKEKHLSALLLPIGRSLPDIDIVGINRQGKNVYAQITHYNNTNKILEKIEKLKYYKSKNSLLFFFGPESQEIKNNDVKYISIEEVFSILTSDHTSIYYEMIRKMLLTHKT